MRRVLQVEGELVSRKRLEELAPEQFSSILILADESATFSTADVDQVWPRVDTNQKTEELCWQAETHLLLLTELSWQSPAWRMQHRVLLEVGSEWQSV